MVQNMENYKAVKKDTHSGTNSMSTEPHFTSNTALRNSARASNQPGKERIFVRFKLSNLGERLQDSANTDISERH